MVHSQVASVIYFFLNKKKKKKYIPLSLVCQEKPYEKFKSAVVFFFQFTSKAFLP